MRRRIGPWGMALLVTLLVGGVSLLAYRTVGGDEGHGSAKPHAEHDDGHADAMMMKPHAGEERHGGPTEPGRRLVVQLHCNACHLVSKEIRHEHGGGHERIAPNLTFEGDKVRPEWLFDFLKGPHRLRPGLKARMPNFRLTDREALALTEHIVTDLRDWTLPPLPARFRFRTQNPEENIKAGAKLVTGDYLDCFKCHQRGEMKPPGPPEEWAPDLALAWSRLRPEWIVRWLLEPQKIEPGTKMPSYFTDEHSGPEDILGGDEGKQIIALRDYLLSLGPDATSSGYAAAKKRYPDISTGEGWRLMQNLNCGGCHDIGRMHERQEVGPPLAHEGSRVRRRWLVNFLSEPTSIRPIGYVVGAPARMPDFRLSQEEAEAITDFLMGQEMPDMPRWWKWGDSPPAEIVERGRLLYDRWNCGSCHRGGSRDQNAVAPAFEGPNLRQVGRRLKPDHLLFWFKGDSGTVDTHPIVPTFGLSDEELKALVAYLMMLR